jgi:TRAP-type C4-dicarboxylate transport system permease small subunit
MMLSILRKTGAYYERLEEVLLVCMVFGMVLLGALQIFFRNVISIGIVWVDPLMRHLVLWIALLGASIATREDRHITIQILPARLSQAVRSRIKGGLQLFSSLVCLVLVYPAIRFVLDDYDPGEYLAFGIPLWLSQIIMPAGWLVLGIRFLFQGCGNLFRGTRN